jgi:hypothetical protein
MFCVFFSILVSLRHILHIHFKCFVFFRYHVLKHHGKEAHAKVVDRYYKPTKSELEKPARVMCEHCGTLADNIRLHELAWHHEERIKRMAAARKRRVASPVNVAGGGSKSRENAAEEFGGMPPKTRRKRRKLRKEDDEEKEEDDDDDDDDDADDDDDDDEDDDDDDDDDDKANNEGDRNEDGDKKTSIEVVPDIYAEEEIDDDLFEESKADVKLY